MGRGKAAKSLHLVEVARAILEAVGLQEAAGATDA